MSRTRVRAEDLFCTRCNRALRLEANHWPEGYICQGCMTRALETYGTCTGCGVERLTPGLASDGGKLYTDCAGGIGDFFCEQCSREATRYRRGVCAADASWPRDSADSSTTAPAPSAPNYLPCSTLFGRSAARGAP